MSSLVVNIDRSGTNGLLQAKKITAGQIKQVTQSSGLKGTWKRKRKVAKHIISRFKSQQKRIEKKNSAKKASREDILCDGNDITGPLINSFEKSEKSELNSETNHSSVHRQSTSESKARTHSSGYSRSTGERRQKSSTTANKRPFISSLF